MFKNGKRAVAPKEAVVDPLQWHIQASQRREAEKVRQEERERRKAQRLAEASPASAPADTPAAPPASVPAASPTVTVRTVASSASPAAPQSVPGVSGGSKPVNAPAASSGVPSSGGARVVQTIAPAVRQKPADPLASFNPWIQKYIRGKAYEGLDEFGSMWGTRAMHQDPTGVLLAKSLETQVRNQRLEEGNYVSILSDAVIALDFIDHDPYLMEIRDEEYN